MTQQDSSPDQQLTPSLKQAYEQQLTDKLEHLTKLLAPFSTPEPEVFRSPPEHYRMRAEFRVWHEGDDLYYIMFQPGTRNKYRVDQLPAANQLINQLMPEVLGYVRDKPVLRRKLFQVDYLTTTTGQALISLLYHRPLDDAWQEAAEQMRQDFQHYAQVDLIGRARKQKIPLHRDRVIETLAIQGQQYQFEQIENSFTQPNALINSQMIAWAMQQSKGVQGDLLELYCGNGNFSLPLGQQYGKVLGTEISRTSVRSAQTNIGLNNVSNVEVVRMSAEECSAAIQSGTLPGRAKHLNLSDYDFQTVLVDPPRAGLDEQTEQMVADFRRIIYISCNPETLAANLARLTRTHRVVASAMFDQFPFTPHIESGVILERR